MIGSVKWNGGLCKRQKTAWQQHKKNYILYTDDDFIENLVCILLLMSPGIFITKNELLEGKQPCSKQFL